MDMVAMTRFDCMIGSSAGMRMAVSQATHHCSQRKAFGRLLTEQPLMQNVLADLAIESEAALTLTLRIARALDGQHSEHERQLARLCTPVGKYWICKRTPQHAFEAMECIGGSGVMEDSPMPRLFRESPVNAIWEGSGNIQCLDVLRVLAREPRTLEAYFAELAEPSREHRGLAGHAAALREDLAGKGELEQSARDLVDRMALGLQAALLVRHAPSCVADAFCRSRLEARGHHQYGTLPGGVEFWRIIERAMPRR
jgi:putative acyl-CoA dehydrogenase